MTKLTIVRETDQEIVFLDYFEDMPVHFTRNKMTGQITVNADDVVRALGAANSFEEFLATDKGLDFINEWKKEHPNTPFFGGAVIKNSID